MIRPEICIGDIRKYAIKCHQQHPDMSLDFYNIYQQLIFENGRQNPPKVAESDKESGKGYGPDSALIPDFMAWDTKDPQALARLIDQIPVSGASVTPLSAMPQIDPKLPYVKAVRPFFISREMPYIHTSPHIDDCFVFLYVYEGSCLLELDHTAHEMHQGELCIISPRVIRRHLLTENDFVLCIMAEKQHFENAFLTLLGKDNFLSEFFRRALVQNERGHMFFMIPPDTGICQIFQRLFQEIVRPDSYSDTVFSLCLNLLFTQIIRSQEETYRYFSRTSTPAAFVAMPYILQYIQENFFQLTLEALADHFHYDKSYLSKTIRRFTGKTYTEIVSHYKLERAAHLLKETDVKISRIAYDTGFGSCDHFSRCFRKYFAATPREYRKKYR